MTRSHLMSLSLMTALSGFAASAAPAADKLIVLSPHRKTIQNEMIPRFEEHYLKTYGREVKVEWVDQGGTSNAVRYLKGRAAAKPDDVGVDVFWGGTAANFVDMASAGVLAPYALSPAARAELPQSCAGIALSDSGNLWHAVVMSSFGIMYNKKVIKIDGLPEPKAWADLADAKWADHLALTDPRKSGTNSTMNMIVLAHEGWDKGWATLTRIAGNTRKFMDSSSDPVHAVTAGDAAAAMVIDFYGLAPVWELGPDNIGFVMPERQTVLDPDPVALVKGGGNQETARRFIDWLMSRDAQKVWILPKGVPGGPTHANLARLAVSPKAYEETEGKRLGLMNPYALKAGAFMPLDLEKAGKIRDPLNDLYGTIFVDAHADLKKAWRRVLADGARPEAVAALTAPPLPAAELDQLASRWQDDIVRNETINKWAKAAKSRYQALADGRLPDVTGKSH